jgi:hypothetical protein
VVAALLVLAGCASTPVSPSNAKQIPSERLLAFQEMTPERTATLVVTRDQGIVGGGCYYSFVLNGMHAARFGVGESARFHVSPGELLLRAGRDLMGRGLCGTGKEHWTQRETVLRPGETKTFRLSIDANGEADIQRADPVR